MQSSLEGELDAGLQAEKGSQEQKQVLKELSPAADCGRRARGQVGHVGSLDRSTTRSLRKLGGRKLGPSCVRCALSRVGGEWTVTVEISLPESGRSPIQI